MPYGFINRFLPTFRHVTPFLASSRSSSNRRGRQGRSRLLDLRSPAEGAGLGPPGGSFKKCVDAGPFHLPESVPGAAVPDPDACYEWQRWNRQKQPYCIRMRDGRPFAFAGLREHWDAPDDSPVDSWTMIATTSDEPICEICGS